MRAGKKVCTLTMYQVRVCFTVDGRAVVFLLVEVSSFSLLLIDESVFTRNNSDRQSPILNATPRGRLSSYGPSILLCLRDYVPQTNLNQSNY